VIKKLFGIVGLFLAVLISGWLILLTNHENHHPTQKSQEAPDAYMVNVFTTQTNEQGQLESQMITPKMIHYAKQDMTDITTPHFIMYGKSGDPWHIYANNGRYFSQQDKLLLWDQVRVNEPKGKNNQDITLLTSEATVYPSQQYAETDKPVTMFEPGVTVKAIGMKAYAKQGVAKLLTDVQGVYDPNAYEKANTI